MSYITNLQEIGSAALGRAVNQTLYVSVNGSGANGFTWNSAYNTIEDALDAASTDGDDATLILVAPHTTNYDIDTTGDPTWTGNYIISGTSRSWSKIVNTHASATSIMKFTGKVMLSKLNFNLGAGTGNGVIMTHGGSRVRDCLFIGEDLTGAATGLHIDGATARHVKVVECDFLGHVTYMTGLLVDNCARSLFADLRFHDCLKAVHVTHADSDHNLYRNLDIGDCGYAFDIDAGNEQHFNNITLHHNTMDFSDDVGDHVLVDINGEFPTTILPDNFTGVDLDTNVAADTWGNDTEILAAAGRVIPFKVVGIHVEADATEKFRVRLSADSGTTHFVDTMLEGAANAQKRVPITAASNTDFVFNQGIRISGSAKSETGGDTATVWVEVQEIGNQPAP